jgi:hypothetical protein
VIVGIAYVVAALPGCNEDTPNPDQLPLAEHLSIERHETRPGATEYIEILVLRGVPDESATQALRRELTVLDDAGWETHAHGRGRRHSWWGASSPDDDLFATISGQDNCLHVHAGSVNAAGAPALCGTLAYAH